jgi:DNA-directed RNA polymerase subunit omega
MARITVEDCLGVVPNRFGVVMVAAKRVKQIMRGSRYLIPNSDDNREVVMALREIAAKKVHFILPRDISS